MFQNVHVLFEKYEREHQTIKVSLFYSSSFIFFLNHAFTSLHFLLTAFYFSNYLDPYFTHKINQLITKKRLTFNLFILSNHEVDHKDKRE